ncbi:AMP-binding protein [Salinarimonas ramus]|uniref:Acyl-ACP synthetase n=1 Tax=Salinarimonas ramus TaxID=690164 RepID=A0A917QHI0_9HYPH|nr:AMP-binding protein [Salinarimonas ramus]GGK49339.1 acyl-ACP synthetase [Salinarimonas ramus]
MPHSDEIRRKDRLRRTLFGALVAARDRFGKTFVILEDQQRQPLTYQRLVLGAIVLGRKLKAGTHPGERVALMMPSVQAAAVALFGLNAFGRVAAMLNFTAGTRNLVAACETARIGTVVTSRKFIEEARLEEQLAAIGEGRRVVYLEDVRESVTSLDKIRALLDALFRAKSIARRSGRPDDPAVVLFTSGAEGAPKAVCLTNANVIANAVQISEHAGEYLTTADTIFSPLPIFHSFGLTAGVVLGLLNGHKVVLYPSPLHYRLVPKLIAGTKATFLLATDTFLQGYARAAGEGDLSSLRFVIAGAERVKEETRRLYSAYDAEILEGYGATECAPVLAVNLPGRNRHGSVGLFLPGIEWRLEPVEGIHQAGRLHVRGPNVMAGYLTLADGTERLAAPPDGWYDTGDIVSVDDGFVTIRGRAKRFAKIGGEMISLAAVETMIQELWPEFNHVVVALPDSRKGEQLILVTDKPEADREGVLAHARDKGFAELWAPRAVLVVAAIPVLGSGKIDHVATVEMARSLLPML